MDTQKVIESINISEGTWYNWKKTKPELIKMIENSFKYEELMKGQESVPKEISHYSKEMLVKDICKKIEMLEEEDIEILYHKLAVKIIKKMKKESQSRDQT